MTSRNRVTVAASAAALLLVLTGCAGADGSDEDVAPRRSAYEPGLINLPETGDPVDGGTVTFGAFAEPAVLDPAETIVAGSTGGLEMAAIYDVLMRWDSAENEVVPQLAESLDSEDDHRTWTLRLRDGVLFSDGTPLDAEAVQWSLERYVEHGADEAMLWQENVERVETPDERTVVFHLAASWPSFDYMLTTGPGMVVAKSADAGGEFMPVGAGPFTFASHKPGEEIVLEANPDYWDGAPHLDRLRTVFLGEPAATQDSFDAGSIDLALLRDPDIVDEELDQETPGFLNMVALANIAVINSGEGRAGEDPRVRQAMAMAIDPGLIFQRAYGGAGLPSNEIFPEYSTWHTGAEALEIDQDKARALLEEAKADGYDGTVRYVDGADKASRATAIAVEASLEAVGFDVEVHLARTVQEQIVTVAVERDFDLAGWGMSWREAGPYGRMFATLHSKGNLTVGMPTGAGFDELFAEFRAAATEDDQRDVMGRIQEEWNEQVPAVVFGPMPEFMAFGPQLRGVVDTTNSMVLLQDAWLAEE
jgi:peptide/nickel transport system substrate-binding protein